MEGIDLTKNKEFTEKSSWDFFSLKPQLTIQPRLKDCLSVKRQLKVVDNMGMGFSGICYEVSSFDDWDNDKNLHWRLFEMWEEPKDIYYLQIYKLEKHHF